MASTTVPVARPQLPDFDLRLPEALARLPGWVRVGGVALLLIALSTLIRTREISGQFWMDEGLATGIASHPLSAIPGVLRHDGSPPLYYVLLHLWIGVFGIGEAATHSLSLVFGLIAIPVGMWAGWSLFGRRAGLMAGVLFAFSSFLTDYSQETRMYSLMALLGLLATAGFLHAFVFRRRGYLILFAGAQALMLYTHAWGIFFGAGSAIAVLVLMRSSDEPRELLKDGLMAYIGAAVVFLPWAANFVFQATHTAAPWDPKPHFGAPIQISRDLLGGDRITFALLFAAMTGFAGLFTRRLRGTREARLLWALLLIPFTTLLLAWISSQITPAWVTRYFAPLLGTFLLLAAWGLSRAGILGALALILSAIFLANPSGYAPPYKSDMRDVGGQMARMLHPGDLVITGQPEQIALTWYYLPGGLSFASTIGQVKDPRYMNWVNALDRLRAANPSTVLPPLIASLHVGQQILFVRPLTEGAQNWEASWTQLVRRRSAQWGAILSSDSRLTPVAAAPAAYRDAATVGDSAILYKKVSCGKGKSPS